MTSLNRSVTAADRAAERLVQERPRSSRGNRTPWKTSARPFGELRTLPFKKKVA